MRRVFRSALTPRSVHFSFDTLRLFPLVGCTMEWVKGWQGKEGSDMPHLRLPSLPCLEEWLHRTPPIPPSAPLLPKSTDFSKQALARLSRPIASSPSKRISESTHIFQVFPNALRKSIDILHRDVSITFQAFHITYLQLPSK